MVFSGAFYNFRAISFLKRWNLLNFILGSVDFLAIAFAFQCSYYFNYYNKGGFFYTEKYLLILFLGTLPFWFLILVLIKITEIPTKRYKVLIFLYLQSAILILFLLILFQFVFKLYPISQLFFIELSFFGFLFLFIIRLLQYKIFKIYRSNGYNHINIVIIADESSIAFIENNLSDKTCGYKIVVIFTESIRIKEKFEKTAIVLPERYLGILHDLIEVDFIDEVFYLKNKIIASEVRETVRSCEELGITFRLKNDDQKASLTSAVNTDFANNKFLSFISIPHNSYALAIKKVMDYNLSLLLIVALFPVFVIISILIKLTSPGPVIYKQARVGFRGREFNLYKFRTMIENADQISTNPESHNEISGSGFKIKEDSGFTRIGKFLSRSGLDELPQLFNVLKGEISITGSHSPLQIDILSQPRS
jgi:lipopolysaccharide/colanic/teichoic acid biosynthesis glycosyltransferase